ncbi:MAG: hypothetical protein ACT4N5_00755 [Nitrosopumilaceae archaeon]
MQSTKKSNLLKPLLLTLAAIAIAFLAANLIGQELATSVSLSIYIPVTVSLVVLSVIISKRFGIKGAHGKAWILFLTFAVLWFIAERISLYHNVILGEELFPSEADAFWLAGYPFLFCFMLWYIKPLKSTIRKKIILFSLAISASLLILSLYIVSFEAADLPPFELAVGIAYPIGDAILLTPAIIGISSFFGGKVNLLWSLMCIAIVIEAIADTGFLLATIDDNYYEGHPVDILFNWYYVIFSFGVYHHITLFKDHRKDPYKNLEELR